MLKDIVLENSWWPISKRLFFVFNYSFGPTILFSLLIERHDFLLKKEVIKEGDWFLYPKTDIAKLLKKSISWIDDAYKPLIENKIVEVKYVNGNQRMYRIDVEKFRSLL